MPGTFALGVTRTIPYKGVCKQSSTVYIQFNTFQGFCFYSLFVCLPPPYPSRLGLGEPHIPEDKILFGFFLGGGGG